MSDNRRHRSLHQQRVEEFMLQAKQNIPDPYIPTEPNEEVRLLRARLIYEEAVETITKGLGVDIAIDIDLYTGPEDAIFTIDKPFNMEELIDGCCDLKVVTTGTLSACGIPDEPFQVEVDNNNLAKFGPGHSWREDGKLIKPPGHKPPNISKIIAALNFNWIMEEK